MGNEQATMPRLYDLVVMGASAGGIEALSLLVATLPPSLPVPIVIAQHLDPNVPSHLGQILAKRSKLPVRTVSQDKHDHLETGVIYVVPADRDVEILDGSVRLLSSVNQHPMPSIDRLLSSAARVYGERVIAVILTGSGSDGTAGAREIKAAGGAVLIENPATASYPMMPASLAPTSVDLVVDLENMGSLIADLITGAQNLAGQATTDTLAAVLENVRQQVGIDFKQYKRATILRRLHRRMVATGSKNLSDYVHVLEQRPEEYHRLASSFLINVTEFFRDESLFNFLRDQVFPDVIASARNRANEIRIWSAGCATGEEAYSIAILLAEVLGTDALKFSIRIFATDVDADAIAFARRGIYPTAALASVPDHIRLRYFLPIEGGGYEVTRYVRNMVIFGEHDLGQRAPFPHMDVVVCRNVLIYFTHDLQVRSLHLFAFSLRDGGYLVLGNAESATALGNYFGLVHPHFKVYRRQGERVLVPPLPVGLRHGYETPPELVETMPGISSAEAVHGLPKGQQRVITPPMENEIFAREIVQRTYTLRERFADQILSLPVGVVVIDRNYDVQTINSAAYALLDVHRPAIGKDLLHLATRVPSKPLRTAIDTMFQLTMFPDAVSRAVTTTVDLEQGAQDDKRRLRITCFPYIQTTVVPDGSVSRTVESVILFISEATETAIEGIHGVIEHAAPPQEGEATGEQPVTGEAELIARLTQQLELERAFTHELRVANQELRLDNDNLRRINEDLLVTQEETQSANEETKTLNEEMQATNEELETLNEELEATVEELHTTNDDLVSRSRELQALNDEKESARVESERGQAQLAAILSSMGDAVIAVGADGEPVLVNEAYHQLVGDADMQLVLEDPAGNPIPPEAAPWRRVGESAPFTVPFIMRMSDGRQRWLEASGRPIHIENRQIGGVVTMRDLSDRSLRALYERFLAQVTHELRNPLAALMVALQRMQRRLRADTADEHLRALATMALRLGSWLNIMVSDLADLQRIQHDRLELKLEPVDLIEAVQQAADDIELIQPQDQPHPPIIVQVSPDAAPMRVLGDRVRIEQIVQNLLSNALKYAPESDHIDVRIRRIHQRSVPDKAEIEVQDYGPGVTSAAMPFLFMPFYQVDRGDTTHHNGLGLGLYIVQQLLTALGGDINAHTPSGRGTVFTVRIPLVAAEEQAAPASDTAQTVATDAEESQ